jgi:DNA-binding transcriptional LysR family regulator
MDIKINQIRHVFAIAECGSFSQAARKLFISQPSLSESIRKLEKSLGIAIFDRRTNPIRLTYAGEIYLKTATRILELGGDLERELNDIEDTPQGQVIVGSSQFVTTYIMPHILTSLRSRYPKIHVTLVELLGREREEAALKGSIQIFFTTGHVMNNRMAAVPIIRERLLLALPPDHALNAADAISRQERIILPAIKARAYPLTDMPPDMDFPRISLNDLRDDPFILLRSSLSLPRMVLEMFDKCGFMPKVVLESQSIAAIHSMAGAGLGNALIPESLVRYNDNHRHPVFYQIEPFFPERYLSVVYLKNRYQSRAMLEFMSTVHNVLRSPVTALTGTL